MTEERSLHRKLAQVMYEAERIPKNGKAPKEMGGYPFVQVGDAADYIRKALAEKVITMMPVGVQVTGQVDRPTAKGGNMTTVDLVTTWRLTDGESGESIEIQSFGAGADGGDKYSGKAMTSAMKYALLSGFLLSTGDDTEAHALPDQRAAGVPDTNGGLIGTAVKQKAKTTDFSLRELADGGAHIGFRIASGAGAGVICEARDDLARAIATLQADIIGQRIQVWGEFVQYEPPAVSYPYKAFRVTRIQTPTFTLPAAEGEPGLASETPAAEADEPTGADSSKAAPQTVPGMDPDAAGGNVTEPDRASPSAPSAADDTEHRRDGKPIQAEPVPSDSRSAPAAADTAPTNGLCGNPSPYGDEVGCELLTGHKGPHKILSNAFPTSWAVPT